MVTFGHQDGDEPICVGWNTISGDTSSRKLVITGRLVPIFQYTDHQKRDRDLGALHLTRIIHES
jgi:hypothetical protein